MPTFEGDTKKEIRSLRKSKSRQPDTGLWEALEEMDRDGVNQLPVMTDGQIQGMLSREDIISYLRTLTQPSV